MHRNHIHYEDTTQSLLIYTERQQRLCACAATHIHHIQIHCEDTIQLLHIYMLMWCSKINWFFALSDQFTCIAITYTAKTWHNLCSYTQNDSNVFAHALQLIHDIHTVIAKARLSFYAHTHQCNVVNRSVFRIIRSIYMHRNHIHCKDMTQSLLIYTEWQ